MIRISRILCPVDFFPASDHAARYAAALARNYNAKLTLLHVVTPIVPALYEVPVNTGEQVQTMTRVADEGLQKLAARLGKGTVSTQCVVRVGNVDAEIKALAEDQKAELIVMGTHGRNALEQWFLGSVTERMLRRSSVPLLTIGRTKKTATPASIRRILVTTDFSEGTADALAYAFSLAAESKATVTLLHVVNDITADISGRYRDSLIDGIRFKLDELIPADTRTGFNVTTVVETGLPFRRILDIAKKAKTDLIVMNVHGKGMLDRALIGSTAERVVRGAEVPVLLVPPMAAAKRRRAQRSKSA